jgi:hemerythrin-like metal-binding protein
VELGSREEVFVTFVMWNPAWETGIPEIDHQHRRLLEQIEALMVALHEDHAAERIPELLAFLSQYVEVHFSTEERQMKAVDYPGLSAHKGIHDGMRSRLVSLIQAHAEGAETVTEQLVAWLMDWLIGHINDHDLPMARRLSATESAP